MKNQIEKIIEDADYVCENHHDMTAEAISEELAALYRKLVNIEDQIEIDRELLVKAKNAVSRVSDRYEMHHGGGATQL